MCRRARIFPVTYAGAFVTETFGEVLAVEVERASRGDAREVDAAVVARLSALPEDSVLDYFWLMSRRGAGPLTLLLQLTHVVIARPADWDRAAIRREHERGPGPLGPSLSKQRCFACLGSGNLYFHHIVEVQNGGSNALRNRAALCFPCHQYLHPWLKEEPGDAHRTVRGFQSLRSILDGGVVKMTDKREQK